MALLNLMLSVLPAGAVTLYSTVAYPLILPFSFFTGAPCASSTLSCLTGSSAQALPHSKKVQIIRGAIFFMDFSFMVGHGEKR